MQLKRGKPNGEKSNEVLKFKKIYLIASGDYIDAKGVKIMKASRWL